MANDLATDFAASGRGFVVAPAGCGKTHLIAEAVRICSGRQLILTHTHAGVRSLLNHLKRQSVAASAFQVCTIDGFALKYASAFPGLSKWMIHQPANDDWRLLRLAALKVLERSAIRRVIRCSYSGFFVDEYQDCTSGQHQLIEILLEILPGRAVGDPLQAIFRRLNKDDHPHWKIVGDSFKKVGELDFPHRWHKQNDDLGRWLLDVRLKLDLGHDIDLRSSPAKWIPAGDERQQLAVCKSMLNVASQSALGLRAHRNQCYKLARNLRGRFRSMETVECNELLSWCRQLESSHGTKRIQCFLDFAKKCLANLPPSLTKWVERICDGEIPKAKRDDYSNVIKSLSRIAEATSLGRIVDTMLAIDALNERPVQARSELWNEMRRAIREHLDKPAGDLAESAWHVRNRGRYIGKRIDHRCLSTTLLVKGLEFDHVAILNAEDHPDAEDLYVAMTRGSRSLTIVSKSPVLQRSPPFHLTPLAEHVKRGMP